MLPNKYTFNTFLKKFYANVLHSLSPKSTHSHWFLTSYRAVGHTLFSFSLPYSYPSFVFHPRAPLRIPPLPPFLPPTTVSYRRYFQFLQETVIPTNATLLEAGWYSPLERGGGGSCSKSRKSCLACLGWVRIIRVLCD